MNSADAIFEFMETAAAVGLSSEQMKAVVSAARKLHDAAVSAQLSVSRTTTRKPVERTDEMREKDRKRKAEKRAEEKAGAQPVRDASARTDSDGQQGGHSPASPPSPSPPRDINQPPLAPPTTPPPASSLRSDSVAPTGAPGGDLGPTGGDLFGKDDGEATATKPPKGELPAKLRASFDEFWRAYPRKTEKRRGEQAFAQAVKRGGDPQAIIAGAQAYAEIRKGEPERFTKQPATWLNAECWKDETRVDPSAPSFERKVVIRDTYTSHQVDMMRKHNVEPAAVKVEREARAAADARHAAERREADADAGPVAADRSRDRGVEPAQARALQAPGDPHAGVPIDVPPGSVRELAMRARAGERR